METAAQPRLMIVAPNPRFVRLFLAQQIALLAAERFEVLLVCAPDRDALADLPCTVRFVEIARAIHVAQDASALFQLVAIIRQTRPSIVHGHGPKPGLLASLAALLCGVATRLHTIHGLRSDGLKGTRHRIVSAMERLTFACSTQCFAVSRSLAGHVAAEKLAKPEKVQVLHYGSWAGVALERFSPARHRLAGAAFRKRHGISAEAVVVTYVGRIAQDKGLHTLTEAWRSIASVHPKARLVVAGPIDHADPIAPATLIDLQFDRSILFEEGFLEDVPALLAASDLFVQPSLREGLGVAALEAAAMQLPVVAARVTGLVDTVRDNSTGLLFPAQDAPALANALEYLIVRPSERTLFGERGRRLVEVRFAQTDVLTAGLDMYRRLPPPEPRTSVWQSFGKRAFDLTGALTLLILCCPIMLVVAVAIWMFLSRPVLFTQQRAGLHGRPIRIFKFRTMKLPAPGQAMIGTDELRTHWLGALLRKLSLDELPQLFNVVRGEMSLIGPRPLLLSYLPRYSTRQQHRHDALPGITGWAQVNGRNAISWEQRFELDLWYVEHRSAALDLKILFQTFRRILWPQGITPSGQTSMPEFLGASNQAHS